MFSVLYHDCYIKARRYTQSNQLNNLIYIYVSYQQLLTKNAPWKNTARFLVQHQDLFFLFPVILVCIYVYLPHCSLVKLIQQLITSVEMDR